MGVLDITRRRGDNEDATKFQGAVIIVLVKVPALVQFKRKMHWLVYYLLLDAFYTTLRPIYVLVQMTFFSDWPAMNRLKLYAISASAP